MRCARASNLSDLHLHIEDHVAGSHLTDDPATITYSSVVLRDLVRITLTMAELNGLDVMCCDVGNAYLNAPCREKVWFLGG